MQVQVLVRIRPASKPRKPYFEMLDCSSSTTILEIKEQVSPWPMKKIPKNMLCLQDLVTSCRNERFFFSFPLGKGVEMVICEAAQSLLVFKVSSQIHFFAVILPSMHLNAHNCRYSEEGQSLEHIFCLLANRQAL